VIKRFNFYDIYGYLLPGTLLLALFWLPFGILTENWPNQDLSKTVFLAAAAYILGHFIQSIANSVVPSKVMDNDKLLRFPSELYLDKTNTVFSDKFKIRLKDQLDEFFKVEVDINADGTGVDQVSNTRQALFFQARTYLLSRKSATYAEQFEGLYALMRGLSISLLAAAPYLAGWALSFHREQFGLRIAFLILLVVALGGALSGSYRSFRRGAEVEKASVGENRRERAEMARKAVVCLSRFLALTLFCGGFWLGSGQSDEFWQHPTLSSEWILWVSAGLALVPAERFYAFYRYYMSTWAQTVWRDFSAYRSFEVTPQPSSSESEIGLG
jgi:hypothetical protein